MPYFGNNPSPLLLNTVAQNGKEMTLDADADTCITADTDDQIDLRVGGIDTFVVKPDVVEIKGSPPDLKLTDSDDTNYGGLFYNNGAINLSLLKSKSPLRS